MLNLMKKKAFVYTSMLFLLSLVVCSVFTACEDPLSLEGGKGLITITIGEGSARAAVPWASTLDSGDLVHTITFSGGEGGPHKKTISDGGGTAQFSVIPGLWTITVEARLSGELIAVCTMQKQINPGNNESVPIQMQKPADFPDFTVRFYNNGGSEVPDETVKKYSKATRPANPIKEGSAFYGWYTEEDTQYDFDAPVTSDITLYARWVLITVPVTGVSLNKENLSLTVGESETLIATVSPSDATDLNVTWSSDAPNIASVSPSGDVSAVGAGTAIITVTTTDGGKTATCAVTVTVAVIPITSAEINITAPTKGGTPATSAIVNGTTFTAGAVTWTPADSPFLGSTEYTVTVTLTAASGHTFTETIQATVNGQTATISNNTGSAITLNYTFAATGTKTVSNIAVKTQPTKLAYTHGDALSLAGLVVTLTYDDGSTEDVATANFADEGITAIPSDSAHLEHITHNGHPVTLSYGNYNAETGKLTVSPKVTTFTIDPIAAQTYTGRAIEPTVTVKDGTITLALTTDYTVSYDNNINAGNASVTVTGAGNYAGSTDSASFTINKATPVVSDFTINGNGTVIYDGDAKTVTVTAISGKSTGKITVKYGNSTTAPSDYRNRAYTITFDVEEDNNWNAATGLSAGTLKINRATPTASDFNISSIELSCEGTESVKIEAKPGKSDGDIFIYYKNIDTGSEIISSSWTPLSPPAGTYTVTFDVWMSSNENWEAVSGFPVGTITVIVNTFTGISDFNSWWATAANNRSDTPYTVKLDDINSDNLASLISMLNLVTDKYVNLDLSLSSISSIYENAFWQCKNLTGIILPEGITEISHMAFSNCENLAGVNIPNSVTKIKYHAFRACFKLTNVIIPDSVTIIETAAFDNCSELKSISIPASVLEIQNGAFGNCSELTSVTFETGSEITATSFGSNVFPQGGWTVNGDNLKDAYLAGGPGTYTREPYGDTWTKQSEEWLRE
jgi:hypothetical protein